MTRTKYRPGIEAMLKWQREHPTEMAAARSKVGPAVSRWWKTHPKEAARITPERNARIRNVPKTGLTIIGEKNMHSVSWGVRAPNGEVFKFKNIREFVRTHATLFAAEDVSWRFSKAHIPSHSFCRAVNGLSNLRPSGRHAKSSWKGWTWV